MPSPMPRPVTPLAFDRLAAAFLAVHFAASATASRTASQRSPLMFCRRNRYGSMLAAYANSSITCSEPKEIATSSGDRRFPPLRDPLSPGTRCLPIRQFGIPDMSPTLNRVGASAPGPPPPSAAPPPPPHPPAPSHPHCFSH